MTDARTPGREAKTYPPHNCHEILTTHYHNQDDATYSTCGVCGRITAFQWKMISLERAVAEANNTSKILMEEREDAYRDRDAAHYALAEARDCRNPLDPCRACIKCLSGDHESALDRLSSARRALAEMREALAPGTPERIFVGLMDECVARGIGSPYAAKHVVSQVMNEIDTLRSQLAEAHAALAAERVGIAHEIRLIFKDAATFYEINECLALARELDPDPPTTPPPPAFKLPGQVLGESMERLAGAPPASTLYDGCVGTHSYTGPCLQPQPPASRQKVSHVCSYDWLPDGSIGCERCAATEGGARG